MTTKYQDLGKLYADMERRHREYVDGCIRLAGKVIDAFKKHLGSEAKLDIQPLTPSAEQMQISPNGVLQENGVAVFAYTVSLEAEALPAHPVHFFLSIGKLGGQGEKSGEDAGEWFVGHDKENYPLQNGGDDKELEPVFAHIVSALEAAVRASFLTEARRPEKAAGNGQSGAKQAE